VLDHLLLDVFTDRPFAGNPLAVFIDPGDPSDALMQAVARELNLSESVFLWSPTSPGSAWRTRIFTPGSELPFAGHPTIGAAFALAATGRVPIEDDAASVVLDEPAGPVPVEIECAEGRPVRCRLTAPRLPEESEAPDRVALVAAASLVSDDIHPDLACATWSAGVPFPVLPVRDLDALARARPSGSTDLPELYVVAPLGEPTRAREWRVRMFAPGMGIPEDPATGAAAAAFAGYLAALDPELQASRTWTLHQGVEMGRPSRIEVTAHRDRAGGSVTRVEVGGAAVIVGSGRIDAALP
jgi:trans-2,3-dihydro-3-hydroxyanthranilate isomerase